MRFVKNLTGWRNSDVIKKNSTISDYDENMFYRLSECIESAHQHHCLPIKTSVFLNGICTSEMHGAAIARQQAPLSSANTCCRRQAPACGSSARDTASRNASCCSIGACR